MEVRREALKEHKIYIYRMPSHLKDFLGKVKPIKEYDWTGTVIKKVVILNFPGVLFAFGKVYQISGNDNKMCIRDRFMIIPVFLMGFEWKLERFSNPIYLGNMLFLGVGASALCFVTWNLAVKLLGAVRTAVYLYLSPVVTILASAIILGEKITAVSYTHLDVYKRQVTNASITAKPFFEKRGYIMLKEQQVFRKGIALTNYIMEKKK